MMRRNKINLVKHYNNITLLAAKSITAMIPNPVIQEIMSLHAAIAPEPHEEETQKRCPRPSSTLTVVLCVYVCIMNLRDTVDRS